MTSSLNRIVRSILSLGTALSFIIAARAENYSGFTGLQLESVSGQLKQNMSGTLEKVHSFGFQYVELVGDYNLSSVGLKAELQSHDLTAVSAHFPYARFRDDPEGLAREAKALGLQFIGCPSLPQREALDEKGCRDAIAIFNRAGEIMAKQGIKFFYHPHGYEFKMFGNGTYFDLMMAETKPEFVHYQMDIFWIVHAGQDPVKVLQKFPGRWVSLHLKDMRRGTAIGGFSGHSDQKSFVALGQGQIDLPALLRTAKQQGVKWYFIEDESAVPDAQIPVSLRYLHTVSW